MMADPHRPPISTDFIGPTKDAGSHGDRYDMGARKVVTVCVKYAICLNGVNRCEPFT